jgi:bifunctional non-homologous end joining protein LigD
VTHPLGALSPDARSRLRATSLPDWTDPMLATLTEERFSDPRWLFERKFDGERCLAFGRHLGKGPGGGRSARVTLKSRNANDITAAYPELSAALEGRSTAADFIVDGEIVAFEGRQTSFQRLQRRIHLRAPGPLVQAQVPVYFYLFDIIHLDGFDLSGLPLIDRKRLLRRTIRFGGPLRSSTYRLTEGERLYADACARGWEGLIAKRLAAAYTHGRSKDWLKFKCASGQELVVGGFTDPKGGRVGFGALLLGYYEGDHLRYAGKVGTGFDTTTLRTLDQRLRALEREISPFGAAKIALRDAAGARVHWVEPKLVAQVVFSEWTADGRLRHPRYEGLRDDKDPREVIRERPSA